MVSQEEDRFQKDLSHLQWLYSTFRNPREPNTTVLNHDFTSSFILKPAISVFSILQTRKKLIEKGSHYGPWSREIPDPYKRPPHQTACLNFDTYKCIYKVLCYNNANILSRGLPMLVKCEST